VLTDLLDQVGGWLDRSHRKRERADRPVTAVLSAVTATQGYIVDWEQAGRDRNRELQLVQAWTEAAVAIRHHDITFARQLEMKAQYWADPRPWTDDDVRRVGIRIGDVAGRARALLGGEI
jgi:hypothetical protein